VTPKDFKKAAQQLDEQIKSVFAQAPKDGTEALVAKAITLGAKVKSEGKSEQE